MSQFLHNPNTGVIALMGSGELTSTMVEVHKELLRKVKLPPIAAFIDTPAGFQLNADQLSERAVAYFRDHVNHPMSIVSFKSKDCAPPAETEIVFRNLSNSGFILMGPGSPTYAVRQWRQTPIREILISRIENGGCLTAASAAALTVGRFTLPVYEIYKVGEDLHWVEGLNLLGHFGFNLAVIPHWNNAEGGTHDTRFCYMGETRLHKLETMLPADVSLLGIDEHTACIMDFSENTAAVKGIGRVVHRYQGRESVFQKGDRFPMDVLRRLPCDLWTRATPLPPRAPAEPEPSPEDPFWGSVRKIESAFHSGIENQDSIKAAGALLDLDQLIWKAEQTSENPEQISQAREIFRELLVLIGVRFARLAQPVEAFLAPLVEQLLELRNTFRERRQWENADAVRDALLRVNIAVEDTRLGTRWRLIDEQG